MSNTSKTCSKCKIEKDVSEFYKGSGSRCKQCHNHDCVKRQRHNPEKNREASKRWYHAKPENRQRSIDNTRCWQKENKERDKLLQFKNGLLRNYGISYECYIELERSQNGKCRICGTTPNRRLDVDHCHTTGKIRGLLCSNCNTALGLLKENPHIFQKAVSYLET